MKLSQKLSNLPEVTANRPCNWDSDAGLGHKTAAFQLPIELYTVWSLGPSENLKNLLVLFLAWFLQILGSEQWGLHTHLQWPPGDYQLHGCVEEQARIWSKRLPGKRWERNTSTSLRSFPKSMGCQRTCFAHFYGRSFILSTVPVSTDPFTQQLLIECQVLC